MLQPLQKSLAISYKLTLPIWPSNPIPRWEIYENVCLHKNLLWQVHSNLFNNGQRPETSQIFINCWMDKQIVFYQINWILISNKYKLQYIQNMDKSQKHHAKWKNPNQKTTYCMMPITWNPRKGKTTMTKSRSQWLLEVRDGEKELTAKEDEEAFWGKGNVLSIS